MQRLFSHQTIHIRDGTVHKHGPRHDPCPGSYKPPLQKGSQPLDSSTSRGQTSLDNSGPPSADPAPPIGNLQPQSKGFVSIWSVLQLLSAFLRHPVMPVQVILLHCWGKLLQTPDHPLVGWICLTGVGLFWEPTNVVGNGITCLQPLNTGFLPSLRSSRINTSAAFPMSRYIQNHPLAKNFQPNWKIKMSELLCAFYCQMTVRLPFTSVVPSHAGETSTCFCCALRLTST